jgi:pyrimidine deaminase RibD-like protein/isopentenyldiphosphate isomerase
MNGQEEVLMLRAIEEAEKCDRTRERDPKVGAVLAQHGTVVDSAYRGEMEPGQHAEFTLLQKKVRSKSQTAGGTVYTTLEPCIDRSHEKCPCAAWIVTKKVRRVVIGILDPNPNICGKGYWHLVNAGIDVDFFPSHLARRIRDQNTPFIHHYQRSADHPASFIRLIQEVKNLTITPYPGLGYGDVLSLQDCPNLREGWAISQVQLDHSDVTPFGLPREHEQPYQQYFEEEYNRQRFVDDGEKFMVAQNPIAFSDSPTLSLETRLTRYSQVQFYCDRVAKVSSQRDALIRDLINQSLRTHFAHALCLHLVVVTADSRILLTKRSPKVKYHPGTWSCSIEENLNRADLKDGPSATVCNLGKRALFEELGLDDSKYHIGNFRILSVFLESDILNISLCGYVELRLDSSAVGDMLQDLPRTDKEFTEWSFIDFERSQLLREIFRPTHTYHPTSGYRLLLTLLKQFGVPTSEELEALPL